MAASNILSGLLASGETFGIRLHKGVNDFDVTFGHDGYNLVEVAVNVAESLAERVEDLTSSDLGTLNDAVVLSIMKDVFEQLGEDVLPTSLLLETIRTKTNVTKNTATAIVQKAEILGFIKMVKQKGNLKVYSINPKFINIE